MLLAKSQDLSRATRDFLHGDAVGGATGAEERCAENGCRDGMSARPRHTIDRLNASSEFRICRQDVQGKTGWRRYSTVLKVSAHIYFTATNYI